MSDKRAVAAANVKMAYEITERTLRSVEAGAPDVASLVRTARDLLFAARFKAERDD